MEALSCRPFGFLEAFDPLYTPNTTDEASMRYTFRQQPEMGQWNLAQLANAMLMVNMLEQACPPPRHLRNASSFLLCSRAARAAADEVPSADKSCSGSCVLLVCWLVSKKQHPEETQHICFSAVGDLRPCPLRGLPSVLPSSQDKKVVRE